jgi:hypothetical protein
MTHAIWAKRHAKLVGLCYSEYASHFPLLGQQGVSVVG